MKRLASLAGVIIALASSLPALAQPAGGDPHRRFERFQQQRELQRQQEFRQRRQERQEQEGRPGRLTPEERQQLRRDIREHGRDVYRDRPRRN